jgi:anti-sigma B factor antagonist
MAELERSPAQSGPLAGARIEIASEVSGTPTLIVSGDLDMSNADTLKEKVASLTADRPEQLIIDFSGLRFIDSAGIAVLVDAASKVGRVHLRRPSPPVRRVIEITGLEAIITVEP